MKVGLCDLHALCVSVNPGSITVDCSVVFACLRNTISDLGIFEL
jgi:hypothetical protein